MDFPVEWSASKFIPYAGTIQTFDPRIYTCATWVPGNWLEASELTEFEQQLDKIALRFAEVNGSPGNLTRGQEAFRNAIGNSSVYRVRVGLYGGAPWTLGKSVFLTDENFDRADYTEYAIIHEYGHVWDNATWGSLSASMEVTVRIQRCAPHFLTGYMLGNEECWYEIDNSPGGEGDAPGTYFRGNQPDEDWAQSFTRFIVPNNYKFASDPYLSPGREQFITRKIDELN